MANDNAGVQIPVIIDIDKACADAAARVEQAMKPLQRKLQDTPLNLSIRESMKEGAMGAEDVDKMLQKVKKSLADVAQAGGTNSALFKGLLESKHYLEDMQRAAKLTELTIDGMANSLNGLNSRLAASRMALQSSALGSPEWQQAAKDIRAITDEMAKWEQKMQTLGMKSGSIEKMRAEITAIEQKWNALSRTQRDGSAGQKVLQQYRQITAEIEKEGKSLSQIIAEEQKRSQLVQRGLQNRRYEQFAMNNLAKTMAGLRQQAQFLQAAMDRTAPNTAQWNAYKAQLEQVNQRMSELTGKTQRQNSTMQQTNEVMTKQSALWSQLRGLAGMYLSVFGGLRLLKNIRETTAEFELQRVALGAVIQDTQKATSLFKQLKAAALESPFEIKDLVTYTKQLAAYQIETDKLFETTKRLADVSAGLGVDMGRLILAYGQVRAASVLRGQELRQFTEAGVPLVDKLAEKFSQLRGEMVSTGEVFELISKRAVPFSMISEIFEDMTEKGGIFYDMQKKQSETLYGQWQKLKDAASIMYDEIGNTSFVRKGMEGIMSLTMNLLRNWDRIAVVLRSVTLGYVGMKVASAFLPTLTRSTVLHRQATVLLSQAQTAYNAGSTITSRNLIRQALLLRKASTAVTGAARAWYKFQAAMLSWGPGLIVTALTTIVGLLISTGSEIRKLNKELEKISTDAALKADQSVRNFTRLADAAIDSSKGLAAQQKAIDELRRTYGDIIPAQKLQIDYLQNLKGNYEELTQAIRENIEMEAKRQKIDQITETYSTQINRKKRQLRDSMIDILGFSEDEVDATFIILDNAIKDGLYDVNASARTRAEQFRNIMTEYFGEGAAQALSRYESAFRQSLASSDLLKLVQCLAIRYKNWNDAMRSTDDSMAKLIGTTGRYAKDVEEMEKRVAAIPNKLIDEGFKKESFEFTLQSQLRSVEEWKNSLSKIFGGVDISEAFNLDGRINFDVLYKKLEDAEPQAKAVVDRIKKAYEQLIPADNFVAGIQEQFIKIAESAGVSMDDLQTNLMQSGDSIEGYIKKLKESSKGYEDSINKMNHANAQFAAGITVFGFYSDEQVKNVQNLKAVIDQMLKALEAFDTKTKTPGSSGSSYQKPKFITDMEEAIKFMMDFKKGYDDLRKYMGSEGALGKEAEIMLGRGLGLGIDAQEQKKAAENLSEWYQEMIDKTMAEMKKRGARGTTVTELLGFDPGKNKALSDFQKLLQSLFDAKTDLDTSNWEKSIEKALSDLSEKVKRSEAAKKFYEDIFKATGSEEIATNFTVSIYGNVGDEFKDRIQMQLDKALSLIDDQDIPDFDIIKKAFDEQDFKTLYQYMSTFPKEVQKVLEEAAKSSEQFRSDWLKTLATTYQKTKTYDERIAAIREAAAKERGKVEADKDISPAQKEEYTAAINKKEAQDIVDVEIEALKNTYKWTRAFEDLDKTSTTTLKSLISMLDEYIAKNAATMSPEQLKTVTQAKQKAENAVYDRRPVEAIMGGAKQVKEARKARKEAKNQGKETKESEDALREGLYKINAGLAGMEKNLSAVGEALQTAMSAFGVDETSAAGGFINGMVEGFQQTAAMIQVCQAAMVVLNLITEANPIGAIVGAIATAIALFTAFLGMKAAKAEKKIKKQKELVEELEKSYDRLEKAIEKAFGSDYIYNYQKQLENLKAQQEAYTKMAELEQSKGKKKSSKKIKEYQDKATEAGEAIEDMAHQLSEFFTGTDLTSAAEDFATAWIDAYKEFSNTSGAITDEFNSMIQNMVTKSIGAKIMQNILQPLFDQIDAMAKDGDLSAYEISEIARQAPKYVEDMNLAMTNMANELAAAGYNLRGSASGLTGISREIASASEESILGLSAAINTQNFYISRIPSIDEKMSQIITLMGGNVAQGGAPQAETPETDLKLQYLSYLPTMASDVNEILVNLKRVISPKGASTATHYIAMR